MKKLNYFKKLNWAGFLIILCFVSIASLSNKSMSTFHEWLMFELIVGLPISLLFLFIGKENEQK